jgi:hypothetical protein
MGGTHGWVYVLESIHIPAHHDGREGAGVGLGWAVHKGGCMYCSTYTSTHQDSREGTGVGLDQAVHMSGFL